MNDLEHVMIYVNPLLFNIFIIQNDEYECCLFLVLYSKYDFINLIENYHFTLMVKLQILLINDLYIDL